MGKLQEELSPLVFGVGALRGPSRLTGVSGQGDIYQSLGTQLEGDIYQSPCVRSIGFLSQQI